jgi:hypothetical protein
VYIASVLMLNFMEIRSKLPMHLAILTKNPIFNLIFFFFFFTCLHKEKKIGKIFELVTSVSNLVYLI